MSAEMLSELMAVLGMANQANARVNGFQVNLDETCKDGGHQS